ncbi:UNKNOWN [Stylonychia lemnae]|uniref:Uncharacterized protein n=1 Tax=Stylonychia lemnae TaxID=5949 RepID=A0A078A199_STYLE|nr:UNKNOWN [Stylonychia lemnae]|eukprot:CDW75855.1 UNKNOWN [Stylonychia lemnae]
MGLCCSTQQNQTLVTDIPQQSARRIIQYRDDAYFTRSEDQEAIKFNFWSNETVKGVKNNGWRCDAASLLQNGCQRGLNKENQTYDEEGFFDLSSDFVLCKHCAKAAQNPQNLIKWSAYISKEGIKGVLDLQYFIIIRKAIIGAGKFQDVQFTIQGAYDLSTGDITLNKLNEGEEKETSFRGRSDEHFTVIRTKYVHRDGTVFKLKVSKGTLKARKIQENFDLPSGSLQLSVHNCELVGPQVRNTGWGCDGRNIFKKCFGGITGFDQTEGKSEYRCETHQFDLCLECAQNVYKFDQLGERSKQNWSGFWIMAADKGEMNFERLHIAKEIVYGKGNDQIGDFIIFGKYEYSNGKMKFRKQYIGKHFVTYIGVISNQGKTVKGDWKIKSQNKGEEPIATGTFELAKE